MEEELNIKPAAPDLHGEKDPEDRNIKTMFSGLDVGALKNHMSPPKKGQPVRVAVSPDSHFSDIKNPENNPHTTMFSGLNLFTPEIEEALKIFISSPEPGLAKKPVKNNFIPAKPVSPETHLSKIRTVDVVASLLKAKKYKRVKESTIATYKKRLLLFQQRFTYLPEYPEAIMDYLSRFDGESGRHRRNNQDLLKMLYDHAVSRFGLSKNPMAELERPIVTRKPVKTLSLEQVRTLIQTPKNLLEKTALDLLLGHGWRQIEFRRVQAKDVATIENLLILCHGKEREELAPLIPETADRLREMARNRELDDYLFVAQQKRHGRRAPLGEDGVSQLVERLMKRAGIKGFTGHDLRRTFATMVTAASYDEFLAMRLLRDHVPGLSERYIRYPMDQLVKALQMYSPLRQANDDNDTGEEKQKSPPPKNSGNLPIPETGDYLPAAETIKESGGDGGELNSPSKGSCPGHTTGLFGSLISPGLPQPTESIRASR